MVETHPSLTFAFDRGLRFASNGVVALPGHTFEHGWLAPHLEFDAGCRRVEGYLRELGLAKNALVGLDVRLPATLPLADFVAFNDRYLAQLDSWGLLRDDVSPLARTNVSPTHGAPSQPELAGFSYVVPRAAALPSFVISGIAELAIGASYPAGVTRLGESSPEALLEKALTIVDVLETHIGTLGTTWEASDGVRLYSAHDLAYAASRRVLAARGHAPSNGLIWFDAAPPVVDLELELDVRRYDTARITHAVG